MRYNDARKWLHAALDLLPVLLIPIFMIYSHRHDVAQDFEIVETQPIYYESNEVNSVDDIDYNNVYRVVIKNVSAPATTTFLYFKEVLYTNATSLPYGSDTTSSPTPYIVRFNNNNNYYYYEKSQIPDNRITISNVDSVYYFDVIFDENNDDISLSYYLNIIEICNVNYVKEYQEVVTTIPHDVMTSFLDRFNNSIDKYFNMGNVFNLNGVYQWFNTNIFGGNAPTIIYSVWNIALYELVMDLLFLLYGLFMWFIDMCKHLMEKPFRSIK